MLEVESGVCPRGVAFRPSSGKQSGNGVEYLQEAVSGTGVPHVIHAQAARATEHSLDCLVTTSGPTHLSR